MCVCMVCVCVRLCVYGMCMCVYVCVYMHVCVYRMHGSDVYLNGIVWGCML